MHLVVNLIRHQKGIYTSIEKWIAKQEPCRTNLELSAAVGLMREVLDEYETELCRVDALRDDEVSNAQDSEPALVTRE